jgi:hypothetical protein
MERTVAVKQQELHEDEIALGGADVVHAFDWPKERVGERQFLTALLETDSRAFVANVTTEFQILRLGSRFFPVTINESNYADSWVCSPYNATITYPLDELQQIGSSIIRGSVAGLIHAVAPLLKAARINRVVGVNNGLLSTNLYPTWDGVGLERLTSMLQQRWPRHAIVFRSLNALTNGPLLTRLKEAGYLLLPGRQVYLCLDLHAAHQKQNSEIDRNLLTKKTGYRVVRDAELTSDDVPRIRELYDQLYLQKYSLHNPQFTEDLIRLWQRTGLMKLIGLRNSNGILDGIVGCLGMGKTMTTPLIGYDLALPRKLGLYRMLTALVFQEARETGRILNLSAGAAQFKRHRGGEAQIEYSAVYIAHLPVFQRAVWASLGGLLRHVGVRILQTYEL